MSNANILKEAKVHSVDFGSHKEFFITAHPNEDEDTIAFFNNLANAVQARDWCIVSQEIFGRSNPPGQLVGHLQNEFADSAWPVTWVSQNLAGEGSIQGTHIWAVANTAVDRLRLGSHTIGSVFEDDHCRYCRFGGIKTYISETEPEQWAGDLFSQMNLAVTHANMEFTNTVRTWFFINEIIPQYKRFNTFRNHFFRDKNIFNAVIPASTAVGTGDSLDSRTVAGLLAVQKKSDRVRIFEVPSPSQCSATSYGSTFSRAVEVQTPAYRRLYLSGTASVGQDGRTIGVDSATTQLDQTLDAVYSILQSRGMNWSNVSRAVAYAYNTDTADKFQDRLLEDDLSCVPFIISHNTICRSNLLFEVELDAIER
jgi:enamine deaminase RidA (YjgF/YER057c/UK114 family)